MTRGRPSNRRLLATLLLAISVVAASCGDDNKASSDGDSTTTTVDVSQALGSPNKATGEPVKIGLITEGGSEAIGSQSALTVTGATMAVKYANEYLGGIAGRPIELVICGNQATPAGAQDCANQMVQDGVVAVTLPFTGYGAATAPVLTKAGIPYVTMSGNSSEELRAPGAFAITGGYPGTLGAFAQHAREQNFKKFAMIVIDVPSATQAAEQLGGIVFGNAGVEFQVVTAAPGTPDLIPQLQSAVDGGAQAVGVTGDVTFCTSFLQAFQTLNPDVAKYVISPCVDPTVIESLGDVLAGSYMTTTSSNEGEDAKTYAGMVAKYAADEKVDPDPSISVGVAAGTAAVMNFVRAMNGLSGDVNKDTVMAQMKAAKDVLLWMGDGQTFTCDGTAVALMPNVCSVAFFIGKLDNKGHVLKPTPVDPSALFVIKK